MNADKLRRADARRFTPRRDISGVLPRSSGSIMFDGGLVSCWPITLLGGAFHLLLWSIPAMVVVVVFIATHDRSLPLFAAGAVAAAVLVTQLFDVLRWMARGVRATLREDATFHVGWLDTFEVFEHRLVAGERLMNVPLYVDGTTETLAFAGLYGELFDLLSGAARHERLQVLAAGRELAVAGTRTLRDAVARGYLTSTVRDLTLSDDTLLREGGLLSIQLATRKRDALARLVDEARAARVVRDAQRIVDDGHVARDVARLQLEVQQETDGGLLSVLEALEVIAARRSAAAEVAELDSRPR